MRTIQFGMNKFTIQSIKGLILIFCMTILVVPFLVFICMFTHEGGHGIIIVPAIILNMEIPEVPSEGMQENPFKNFSLGILSLFLAFPLGILANGVLLYLSYKNARNYRCYESKKGLFLMILFISFSILNLAAIFTNFFGQDFAFIFKDIFNFPSDEQWFKYILRLITYFIFPVILAARKEFKINELLIISATTYLTNMIVVELIIPPLAPILMSNFWWLFIIGLPILFSTAGILVKSHGLGEKRVNKSLEVQKSQISI